MKRTVIALLLLTGCADHDEVVHIVDRDGVLAAQVHRHNGAKVGPVVFYWPNGNRRLEGQYAADQRSGWWRGFHPDGSVRSLTGYVDGAKEGPRIHWDKTGRPMRALYYAHGLPNGDFYRFFPDGRLAQHSVYVDGILHGPHDQWYDDAGGTRVNGWYVQGAETGLWTEWDTTGRMIWQAYLKDGEISRAVSGVRRLH
jgi:antitoxin component YwqK of YwqJK toxin-antitoxin module